MNAIAPEGRSPLVACGRRIPLSPPIVMGIVNATPDSFSDGGEAMEPEAAAAKALRLVAAGAGMIDIGAESTRPGYDEIDPAVEEARLIPVLDAVRLAVEVPISIDTRHAGVAAKALAHGAEIVNDVSAMADPGMAETVAATGAGLVLMHGYREHVACRGWAAPDSRCTAEDVAAFLEERIAAAMSAGIRRESIVADPGLGFGKTNRDSAEILRHTSELLRLGVPILVGPSRKRFLREMEETRGTEDRDEASRIAAEMAIERGAAIVRLHAPFTAVYPHVLQKTNASCISVGCCDGNPS